MFVFVVLPTFFPNSKEKWAGTSPKNRRVCCQEESTACKRCHFRRLLGTLWFIGLSRVFVSALVALWPFCKRVGVKQMFEVQ